MDKPVLEQGNLYNDLLQIDIELALEIQEKGCPHCGCRLHRANYPRVPKGLSGLFDISHVVRFSFCCSGEECRRRTTPPSVRFLGRKQYLGVLVLSLYQIDQGCKRLLWPGRERRDDTLESFFTWFGEERSGELRYVCSDMRAPYLKIIKEKAGQAIHVLDRFHIMANMSKAIDKVRAEEPRKMRADGYEPLLTSTRWLLLKRPENLTDKQEAKLSDLLQYNLKSVRAYLLKEDFQQLWQYVSPYWAGKFLDRWCTRTMRSQIDPMKKMAKQISKHKPLIINWIEVKGQFSSGIVEGFNNKAKLTMRKSYGFKSPDTIEIALYHALGALPEPKTAHRFF